MDTDGNSPEFGPWNPGLSSELPRKYLSLSTMFRPENVRTSIAEVHELSDFCGLPPQTLSAFRAGRLTIHELLIAVTADLSVPDGPNDEDLGINLRTIAATILDKHISPNNAALVQILDDLRSKAIEFLERELAAELFAPAGRKPAGRPRKGLLKWFGSSAPERHVNEAPEDRERRVIASWRNRAQSSGSAFDRACLEALATTATAVAARRGRVLGDTKLLAGIAATLVCNERGSALIGEAIAPMIAAAVEAEGFRFLPRQDKPVVMNVKGASASGKSTMRHLQKTLAARLDIPWDDFAVITPDIWRKFLLDYDSLGESYKYAGTMSGHELEIIDKKFDAYMARKAGNGRMSHLLVDRFRFDSFVPETEGDEASKLLTRFGDLVYMFFMITPPEATVERAWRRGLKVGRFKAVDDLLDHNIEAYTGMPQLFFTWALRTRKRVHFEFLDNSVKQGERPRTVAFGWNGEMNILDVKAMIDIDRFRKININAHSPDEVYTSNALAASKNLEFLKQCVKRLPVVTFADHETGEVYGRVERGEWTTCNAERLNEMMCDETVKAGLAAVGAPTNGQTSQSSVCPCLNAGDPHTLGVWGGKESSLS